MPDPDPLAAELAVIRDRHALAASTSLGFSRIEDRHEAMIRLAYEDVPRLLKALGIALEHIRGDSTQDGIKAVTEAMTAGAISPGRCICPPQILARGGSWSGCPAQHGTQPGERGD